MHTTRRQFLAQMSAMSLAMATTRTASAAGDAAARVGLASFSCHLHWRAAQAGAVDARFNDARGFFDYARSLGGAGVQASLRGKSDDYVRSFRTHVEKHNGYFEGDVGLPAADGDWDAFDADVRRVRLAGATVARTVLTGGRRYEVFKSLDEFRAFHAAGLRRLQRAEPIVRKHQLRLAVENHKDLTAAEQSAMLKQIASEWIGATIDTGNNIALLEDPQATIDLLAPFAMTVHLKDIAVQPHDEGFRLSEVVFGTGFLDLPKLIATLRKANPAIVLNIEMATRDPLVVPCKADRYWKLFEKRDEAALSAAIERVRQNPPKAPPPSVGRLRVPHQLMLEEENNRKCLDWLRK